MALFFLLQEKVWKSIPKKLRLFTLGSCKYEEKNKILSIVLLAEFSKN